MDILFLTNKIKTILFPPSCAFCGAQTEEYYSLCSNCWFSLKFINQNICHCCGEAITKDISEKYTSDISTQCCKKCINLGYPSPKHDVVASIIYDDFSKRFIMRLKEKNEPHLALVFAKFFHKSDFQGMDYIIPVPLHPMRLWQRTYNQAALLALGIHYWNSECPKVRLDLLKRIHYTAKQKGKNAEERLHNVQNHIIIPHFAQKIVKNKRIAVVDDVIASGATFSECKRVLQEAGAKEVRCLALAQTL